MTFQNDISMKEDTHIGEVAHAAALVALAADQGCGGPRGLTKMEVFALGP